MSALHAETQQDEAWRLVEAIERALQRKTLWLKFPDELEEQFERESMRANRKALCIHVLMGAVFVNIFGFFDHHIFANAEVIAKVFFVRTVLFPLVSLALAHGVYNASTPTVRDVFLVIGGFWVAGVAAFVLMLSSLPDRVEILYGVIPISMFAVFVLRLRFPSAVFLVCGLVFLHALGMFALRDTTSMAPYAGALVAVTGVFILIAGHRVEREYRTNYLTSLRERLRTESFERLAEVDALTGVANRRALEARLADIKHAEAVSQVAVVFADIDYFKAYNDNFGHQAGDDCLKRTAQVLLEAIRNTGDTVYRYGGEEFVVVLAGMGEARAAQVAERMRRGMKQAGLPHCWPDSNARVTVSFGVAAARLNADFDVEDLFARADEALYQAKSDGRDCVRRATELAAASDAAKNIGAAAAG